jgi:pyrroline-5-carboxylate reductase
MLLSHFFNARSKSPVEACLRHSHFKKQEAEQMVLKTLLGTAKSLQVKNMGFEALISAVATNGVISEEGIKVLDRHLPTAFDHLVKTTMNKHNL